MSEGFGCRIAWQVQGLELFILTGTWEVEPSEGASRAQVETAKILGTSPPGDEEPQCLAGRRTRVSDPPHCVGPGRWATGRHSRTQGCEQGPGSAAGGPRRSRRASEGGCPEPPSHPCAGPSSQPVSRRKQRAAAWLLAQFPWRDTRDSRSPRLSLGSPGPQSLREARPQRPASASGPGRACPCMKPCCHHRERPPHARPPAARAPDSPGREEGVERRASHGNLCAPCSELGGVSVQMCHVVRAVQTRPLLPGLQAQVSGATRPVTSVRAAASPGLCSRTCSEGGMQQRLCVCSATKICFVPVIYRRSWLSLLMSLDV